MNLISVKLSRTTNGVRLYAKSEIIEEYIRSISNRRTRATEGGTGYAAHTTYNLPAGFTVGDCVMNRRLPLIDGRRLNVFFFTVEGLGEGVEIDLPEVHSNTTAKFITEGIAKAAAEFYDAYMNIVDYSVVVEVKNTTAVPA